MVRVLIVDDEPTILSTVAAMLRMENYAVSTACDGQEGLDRARACQPDLIITDFNMPKLNGLALLSPGRRKTPTEAGATPPAGAPGPGPASSTHIHGTGWKILRSVKR